MSKAIEQLSSGLTVGHCGLGLYGDVAGSVKQQVHDGDTINVRAFGNFSVRFAGIDTPEISFTLPGKKTFISISDERWDQFLIDPFDPSLPAFNEPLQQGLVDYLVEHTGVGTATNHYFHALAAQRQLEHEVNNDLVELRQTKEEFAFFLTFATDIMDRYGRMLAYINREQKEPPRPLDYNGRMLQSGKASPYFIWPNIPFRKQLTLRESVPEIGTANDIANEEKTLRDSRRWVQEARQQGMGIFNRREPLKLQAFELRFLAQRRVPNRWVIDLSKNDDVLIHPQQYFTVPNVEDRLFVPDDFVPLFLEKGWILQE
ncbi:MAG: hypothetical protein AB1489_32380 [Acidobacteriota bacterium]